ncbi:MAG: CoA transferase [Eubacterium sp.]|nr:CoA transferase [Eubacterium sp.]
MIKKTQGALTGLKVLDFSTLLPGPYATMTLADWMAAFEGLDICVEPVLSMAEALEENAQLAHRKMVVEVPLEKGTRIRQPANPLKLSKTPPRYDHGGYPTGHDTQEILEALGLDDETIEEVQRP